MTRVLYRYLDMRMQEGPTIILKVMPVVRETPKCWVILRDGVEYRVLKGNGKRWAHEQIEWARYSYRRRRAFYMNHLQIQLAHLEAVKLVPDSDLPVSNQVGEHGFPSLTMSFST